MCIFEELEKIWERHQKDLDNNSVFKRRFVYARPQKSDILITGINPSDNGESSHSYTFDTAKNAYFTRLKKIDKNAAYIDLFYIRGKQIVISEFLHSSLLFMVDQLELTQKTIEEYIMPKLILVFNKESWRFWGFYANKKNIWMGYDLEFVKDMKYGKLMKIKGLINHPDRVLKVSDTNLKGTVIYFSKYLNRCSNNELEIIKTEVEELKSNLNLITV